ncbi:thioredoxin family protein [Virgibacillus sediminis]|uniref:Thioredoxin family protein n=1 Tax=Virgibacillus sediminis TaxID=202260 RepID=A0ABV7A6P4_9BACI
MVKLENINQFEELKNNGKAIMLFTADWCPDCRVIEPELADIERKYPDYTFVEVNRDEFIDLCQEYGVFGIPSFLGFKEGEETGRFVSKDRKTKDEIMQFISGLPD